jgi:hypothetical protein
VPKCRLEVLTVKYMSVLLCVMTPTSPHGAVTYNNPHRQVREFLQRVLIERPDRTTQLQYSPSREAKFFFQSAKTFPYFMEPRVAPGPCP